ncbi:hypothetical protein M3J09_012333 [Ascochyta lentis]
MLPNRYIVASESRVACHDFIAGEEYDDFRCCNFTSRVSLVCIVMLKLVLFLTPATHMARKYEALEQPAKRPTPRHACDSFRDRQAPARTLIYRRYSRSRRVHHQMRIDGDL